MKMEGVIMEEDGIVEVSVEREGDVKSLIGRIGRGGGDQRGKEG